MQVSLHGVGLRNSYPCPTHDLFVSLLLQSSGWMGVLSGRPSWVISFLIVWVATCHGYAVKKNGATVSFRSTIFCKIKNTYCTRYSRLLGLSDPANAEPAAIGKRDTQKGQTKIDANNRSMIIKGNCNVATYLLSGIILLKVLIKQHLRENRRKHIEIQWFSNFVQKM